ncbi:HdeD family acid-resistance protein [Orrella daihaiensis]|uniref:HdeD family acid-resistance protein n=1 Tax=Orrella daihaiensis TaxID=2782176 RepID=A0ABY4ALT7_9BURK|nr:HdeD family acid-resistance protein [Orrella daihaiensis]UOD51271.1 HdeD family acid-resistance protein [Orrella daihaiensis]
MQDNNIPPLTPLQKQIFGEAVKHSGKLIAIGVLLVVCGMIGLIAETAFSYASISILGAVAFVGGVFMAIHAFQSKGWRTFLIQSLFAALYIGLGVFVWMAPLAALEGLTIWLAALFLVTGVLRIIAAIQNGSGGNMLWPALSGVLTIILGVMILNSWPEGSTWVPGLLLAIELLLQGWALVFIGLAIKRASQKP